MLNVTMHKNKALLCWVSCILNLTHAEFHILAPYAEYGYAECHLADCRILFTVML